MCLCCGSFGKGREGQLIACSQCGQSYHPYCVGVKVSSQSFPFSEALEDQKYMGNNYYCFFVFVYFL